MNTDGHYYRFTESNWQEIMDFGNPDHPDLKGLVAEAFYRGGEKILSDLIGYDHYLPYNLEDVIAVGLNILSGHLLNLKSTKEIEYEILDALKNKKGYSLIRLGDGELLALTHDIVLPTERINEIKQIDFLSYAGINIPNHVMRDKLTENLLESNAIGIPTARYPTFQRLLNKLISVKHLPLDKMNLTSSIINYDLNKYTTLYHQILMNHKVLLVGNKMLEGKEFFLNQGYTNISGVIPVNGLDSVDYVVREAKNYDYDIALVSAGIPANLICVELAKENKIAIDFGHMINYLIKGTIKLKKD